MAPQKRLFGDCSSGNAATTEADSEIERVMRRRYGDDRSRDKGVPRSCDCSAAVRVHTSNDPTTRGMQFLHCPYDISDGPGQGCRFRRPWNQAILDEFEKIREDNAALQKSLEVANEKIEELEIRVSSQEDDGFLEQAVYEGNRKVDRLMEKYEELAAQYAWIQEKYNTLKKYL